MNSKELLWSFPRVRYQVMTGCLRYQSWSMLFTRAILERIVGIHRKNCNPHARPNKDVCRVIYRNLGFYKRRDCHLNGEGGEQRIAKRGFWWGRLHEPLEGPTLRRAQKSSWNYNEDGHFLFLMKLGYNGEIHGNFWGKPTLQIMSKGAGFATIVFR